MELLIVGSLPRTGFKWTNDEVNSSLVGAQEAESLLPALDLKSSQLEPSILRRLNLALDRWKKRPLDMELWKRCSERCRSLASSTVPSGSLDMPERLL